MSKEKYDMSAGEALWDLERPEWEYPNRLPWSSLPEKDRWRYQTRAEDVLTAATNIREKMSQFAVLRATKEKS